ncbi:hypothetical protein FEM48_Zijuj05G0009300 [Ziziphus jujuba var. spinosa]|uniref:Uncharacterized protein n=1 Tax=Ziziphus jujuba var. spinosa TaxID=714518 RepID=A0A978VBV3_ZIZJJ|nr:hypothetical protein FEM48_Zijuj05G0009300 [Ziziphus jujuba var. spinosa]
MKEIDKIEAIDRYISHLQFEANQIEGLLCVTNDKWIVNAIPGMLSHLKADELKAHKKMKELIEAKGDDDEFKVKLEFQRKNQSLFMQMQKEEGLKLISKEHLLVSAGAFHDQDTEDKSKEFMKSMGLLSF